MTVVITFPKTKISVGTSYNAKGKRIEMTTQTRNRQPCPHWWLLESPNGVTSRGRCKNCGEERDFVNSLKQAKAKKMVSPSEKYR